MSVLRYLEQVLSPEDFDRIQDLHAAVTAAGGSIRVTPVHLPEPGRPSGMAFDSGEFLIWISCATPIVVAVVDAIRDIWVETLKVRGAKELLIQMDGQVFRLRSSASLDEAKSAAKLIMDTKAGAENDTDRPSS